LFAVTVELLDISDDLESIFEAVCKIKSSPETVLLLSITFVLLLFAPAIVPITTTPSSLVIFVLFDATEIVFPLSAEFESGFSSTPSSTPLDAVILAESAILTSCEPLSKITAPATENFKRSFAIPPPKASARSIVKPSYDKSVMTESTAIVSPLAISSLVLPPLIITALSNVSLECMDISFVESFSHVIFLSDFISILFVANSSEFISSTDSLASILIVLFPLPIFISES